MGSFKVFKPTLLICCKMGSSPVLNHIGLKTILGYYLCSNHALCGEVDESNSDCTKACAQNFGADWLENFG